MTFLYIYKTIIIENGRVNVLIPESQALVLDLCKPKFVNLKDLQTGSIVPGRLTLKHVVVNVGGSDNSHYICLELRNGKVYRHEDILERSSSTQSTGHSIDVDSYLDGALPTKYEVPTHLKPKTDGLKRYFEILPKSSPCLLRLRNGYLD